MEVTTFRRLSTLLEILSREIEYTTDPSFPDFDHETEDYYGVARLQGGLIQSAQVTGQTQRSLVDLLRRLLAGSSGLQLQTLPVNSLIVN